MMQVVIAIFRLHVTRLLLNMQHLPLGLEFGHGLSVWPMKNMEIPGGTVHGWSVPTFFGGRFFWMEIHLCQVDLDLWIVGDVFAGFQTMGFITMGWKPQLDGGFIFSLIFTRTWGKIKSSLARPLFLQIGLKLKPPIRAPNLGFKRWMDYGPIFVPFPPLTKSKFKRSQIFGQQKKHIHPRNLTWNLKRSP